MLVKNHSARQSPPPTATSSTTAHAGRSSPETRPERYTTLSCCSSKVELRILSSASRGQLLTATRASPVGSGLTAPARVPRSDAPAPHRALDLAAAQADVPEHAVVERHQPPRVAPQPVPAGDRGRGIGQALPGARPPGRVGDLPRGPVRPRVLVGDGRREHGP